MNERRSLRLRTIALPPEHGSWGLVVEPIALGILLAPTLAGACLGAGAFFTFLARRPLKLLATRWRHERSDRMTFALYFFLFYGALAAVALGATFLLAGIPPLVPLLLGSPLVFLFLAYDLNNQSRSWQAELAGAVVFALVTTGIMLTAGWPTATACAVAAVLVGRALPSVLYVRSRIRLDRGRPHDAGLAIVAHVGALGAVVGLVLAGLLPRLAIAPFVLLLARAGIGLSPRRRRVAVRTIGFTEMAYGILTVLAVAIGFWAGNAT